MYLRYMRGILTMSNSRRQQQPGASPPKTTVTDFQRSDDTEEELQGTRGPEGSLRGLLGGRFQADQGLELSRVAEQRDFHVSASSQLPSAQTIPYTKMAYSRWQILLSSKAYRMPQQSHF